MDSILGVGMDDTTGEFRRWWPMVEIAIVNLTVVSLAYLAYLARQKRVRLPPGPRGWPVVGSLHLLGSLPHRSLEKLSKQYGPVMFLHLGLMPTVVVSNAKMAEAVLKTNDHIMASRPDLIVGRKLSYNRTGLGWTPYGPYWRNMRKICMQELLIAQRLKQFQAMRQREVLAMLHSILETSQQRTVIIKEFLFDMNANNITQMVVSKRYCYAKSDSKSTEAILFRDMVKEFFDLHGAINIADYIPFLEPLDLQGYGKRMKLLHEKWDTFLATFFVEHRQQSLREKPDKASNFLEVLLACTVSDDLNEGENPLPDDNIKAILTDLITAGTDTSTATVEWALAELLKHPSMLKRAHEELDLVVGRHRFVDEADIPKLKYIQAVVKETMRLHAPGPLMAPHESIEDCEIAGYHIPAKSRIFVNVGSVQRDPLVWRRPLEFEPDRFLSTTHTTDVKGNDFDLLPFGSGRRSCPGMNLGLIMVQFPLAQILHTLNWALPEDQKPEHLDMSESFGLICRKTIPLHVLVKPRLSTDVIYPTNV